MKVHLTAEFLVGSCLDSSNWHGGFARFAFISVRMKLK